MNVNLSNMNQQIVKQDSLKPNNKNIKSDKSDVKEPQKFEDSLTESINSDKEPVSTDKTKSESKVEVEEVGKDLSDAISEEDKKVLESIMCIMNLLSSDEINLDQNFFDFSGEVMIENIDMKITSKEGLNFGSVENVATQDLENFENNNFKAIENVLTSLGFEANEVMTKSITNGDVLQKVMDNSESFKSLIKNEFNKIGENNFGDELVSILDNVDFSSEVEGVLLNGKDLLKNIQNEMSVKLNSKVSKGESNTNNQVNGDANINAISDNNNLDNINNFKSISTIGKIQNSDNSDEAILKEISGDVQVGQNIENRFVDLMRNGIETLDNVNFNKTLDLSNPTKFVREFIENIEYMSTNNKTEMIVKVNPDHLGKMDIKYEVAKDSIRLMIKVENHEALKLMEGTIADIRNMIKETHNINLENIQVDLQQFEFNSNGDRNNQDNQNNNSQNVKNNPNIKLEDEEVVEEKRDLRKGILV